MNWREALEIVVARTKHERFRVLCGDEHPDRELWRLRMIEQAVGPAPTVAYPPLGRQALNLAGAMGRAAAAAVKGKPVLVPAGVLEARRALCLPCEFNGERATGGLRCTRCGCGGKKLGLATEACPLDPPKWGRWEGKTDGGE